MDLPDAAAKSSNAEEAAIGRRIDVIHFNHRQVGAKASPGRAGIGGAIDTEESSRVNRVFVEGANQQPGNRYIWKASVSTSKGKTAVGGLGDAASWAGALRSDIEGAVVGPFNVGVETGPSRYRAN